jgi:hypothetical protein
VEARKEPKDEKADKEPVETPEQAAAREKANAAYAKGEQPLHHLAINELEGEPVEPAPSNPDSWMGEQLAQAYRNQEPPPPETLAAIGTPEQKAAAAKDQEAAAKEQAKKDEDKRTASDEDAKRKAKQDAEPRRAAR